MMDRRTQSIIPVQWLQSSVVLLILILSLFLPRAASGETASDITADCTFAISSYKVGLQYLFDDQYRTEFYISASRKAYVEMTAGEGLMIGGIYVKWYMYASPCRIDVLEDGQWKTVRTGEGEYLVEYFALPENAEVCRVYPAEGKVTELHISELRVYSGGDVPRDIQQWEPVASKCDLLVIAAHPDDEFIFMGGSIPYYHAEGRTVEVMYVSGMASYRKLELLDGLWLCGIRNYPILGVMPDNFELSLQQLYREWSKNRLYRFVVDGIRQCKPDVVVTHDANGEYGHAAHKAAADAAIWAVMQSADAKVYPGSAEQYGGWQVSKLYLHLYKERPVVMDWRTPLAYYQGESAFAMAVKGFAMHRSQQKTDYEVLDEGPYDNRLFGLYYSLVGDDVLKNDFLENLPSGLNGVSGGLGEQN
jgi:LmbE family N-acetylglucosaminyl deacetylase